MGLFLRVTDNGPSQQLVRNQQVVSSSLTAGSIANLLFAKDLQRPRLFHAASHKQIMSPRSEQMSTPRRAELGDGTRSEMVGGGSAAL